MKIFHHFILSCFVIDASNVSINDENRKYSSKSEALQSIIEKWAVIANFAVVNKKWP